MKLKVIVTGATGMVGEGVLHQCLLSPAVEEVLAVVRKPSGVKHTRLKEVVHTNFFETDALEPLFKNYNACFFCLGVSSVGMNEADYTRLTHTLTMNFASTAHRANPDMTFCYVSGAATDSTEKGRSMWARVKGRTENDLLKLFRNAYMFRPGYMQPTKGLKNTLGFYKYVQWMYPFLRLVLRNSVSTLAEVGDAMINVTLNGYEKRVVEVKDIVKLAKNR